MLKIRFQRKGTKGKPFYRIVVTDERRKLAGPTLANLGFWFPQKEVLKIDKEKLKAWRKKGAKPTDALVSLLKE